MPNEHEKDLKKANQEGVNKSYKELKQKIREADNTNEL